MIGSKFSRHFVNQSEVKPKPIVARACTFSRALCRLRIITSSFDWSTGMSPSFLIGQSNYFGFSFTTLDWNSIYWNRGKQLFRKGLILQNKNCSLLLTKSKNTALWYRSRKHLFVILLPSTTIKRRSHFWNRKQTWGVQRITTNESNHFDWLTIQTIQVSRDLGRRSGKLN